MTRMIRAASLALVLVCVLFVAPVWATDVVVNTDGVVQDGLMPESDRGPETTVQYGDPDDISGNRGNVVFGAGVEMNGVLVNGSDDPAALLIAWMLYLDLLSL